MPLTLEQYAAYLDTRDLSWPAPLPVTTPSARPHLRRLPGIRLVTWNLYGTLLAIGDGELHFEHPNTFIMELALDKTLQEFKMWGSMTRKPGQPFEYLRQLYTKALDEQRLAPSHKEKHPELSAERVWENIIKKLLQKDYQFDAGFFGSLNEYSKKVAYFFHANLQGTACYPGAAEALRHVRRCGLHQGLLANAQCFSLVQLQRGLTRQDGAANLDDLFEADLRVLSCDLGVRKPSERLYKNLLEAAAAHGIQPHQVLHIGSRIAWDVRPARKLGMRTALFAGDAASLQASKTELKVAANRPDRLMTELGQLQEIIATE
jgi:FMN phosphatase YigB (HAD superfamily)